MIKKMKKFLLIILLISISIGTIPNVEASAKWDVGSGNAAVEDYIQTEEKDPEPTPLGEIKVNNQTTRVYSCEYKYSVGLNTKYEVSVYDMDDVDIMEPNFTIKEENRAFAGTAIGINILERKQVKWEVKPDDIVVTVTETTETPRPIYTCEYEDLYPRLNNRNDNDIYFNTLNSIATFLRIQNINPVCETTKKTTYSWNTCPTPAGNCKYKSGPTFSGYDGTITSTRTYTASKNNSIDKTKIEECQEKAIEQAIKESNWYIKASYSLEMTNSNDINGTEGTIQISNTEADEAAVFYDMDKNEMSCGSDSNKWYRCKFTTNSYKTITDNGEEKITDARDIYIYYKKDKTCINVKTSEVSYKSANESCDSDTEMEISNTTIGDLEHWHYFIPLNAKSTDSIEIKMLRVWKGALDTTQCLYVMKHNPVDASNPNSDDLTYVKLIKPKEAGAEFDGDYQCYDCNPDTGTWNDGMSADYAEVQQNGCSLTSVTSIPVKQGFYNEVTTTDTNGETIAKLNGFNFYYKPIDTNNPFPNGIGSESLWDEWYQEQINPGTYPEYSEPNLSEAFDKITYIASNINSRKVREYNEKNTYTSWSKMDVDGTSEFIKSEGIVTRTNDAASVYKLGCGPLNIKKYLDDAQTIENLLYQKECTK